jgi:hypothetical protein
VILINKWILSADIINRRFKQRRMIMGCCGGCGGEGHEPVAEQKETEEAVETTEED